MYRIIIKKILLFVKKLDQFLVAVTIKLMRFRYRTGYPIHPKHLFDKDKSGYLEKLLRSNHGKKFTFLDLGCGAGSEMVLACKHGASLAFGVEYSNASRLIAAERLKKLKPKSKIFNLNLEKKSLPIADKSVDIINFTNVLEHLINRQQILIEVTRVLKNEGVALISIPNKNTPWKKLQRRYGLDSRDDVDHKIEYSENSIKKELEDAGLVIVSPLEVIVPSMPIHGLLCLLSIISPNLYLWGQSFKRRLVKRHSEHTIGWIFTVKKKPMHDVKI